jgi:hypothetical protein
VESFIRHYLQVTSNLVSNHGVFQAVKKLKEMKLHVTKFLAGEPLLISSNNIGLNKAGLPRALGPLQALARSTHPSDHRFLLTLLSLSRTLKGGHQPPDLSSITDHSKGTITDYNEFRDEVVSVLKGMNIPLGQDQPRFEKFHISQKQGPLGQSMMSAVHDAHNLLQPDKAELLESIYVLGGNPVLKKRLEHMLDIDIKE